MRHVTIAVLLAAALAAPARNARAGGVAFTVLSGERTGLKKIIEAWAAEELELQGGKYGSHGWWLWGLSAVDIDGDGDPDLIPTHHGSPGGLILRNTVKETGTIAFVNATAEFGVASRKLPQGIGRRTLAMDLNGDGRLDLVGIRSPHHVNQDGKKFLPHGKKGFSAIHPKAIRDVNGDGYPDILEPQVAWILDPKTVSFKTTPHPPAFADSIPQAVTETIAAKTKAVRFWRHRYLTGEDLNCDGVDDVVVSGYAGYNGHPLGRYLIADKAGKLTDRTEGFGLPKDAAPIKLIDLTGDGAVDVLAAWGNAAGVFVNDGKGRFTLAAGPVTDFLKRKGPYLHRAWTVDFDCDGDWDLVLSNPRYRAEEIHENLGGGKFKRLHKATGWDSDPVAICDVNVDGLPDVAIGGPGNSITIYLNASPKPGTFCNLCVRAPKPNVFAAGARVEVFAAGKLGLRTARRLARFAPADGTPVRIGLGKADTFDLRVTFGGEPSKVVELKAVKAAPELTVTPGGIAP